MPFGAHIQSADEFSTAAAANTSVTLGAAVTSGNILFVTSGVFQNATDILFSDDKGNSYQTLQPVTYGNGYFTKVAYLLNVTNGPTTITATPQPALSNYTFRVLSVDEFTGTATAQFDKSTQTLHQAATTVTSGAVTPQSNGELLFAATDNETSTTITGPGAPWTARQPAGSSGTCGFHAVMYATQNVAASISGVFTYTATSNDAWAGIFTFQSAPFVPPAFGLMGMQAW